MRVEVARDLRIFLAPRQRADVAEVKVDGTATLGHLVQSLGVPLTEVSELLVDGRPVAASYRPTGGETVEVLAVRRPQPLPTGERFLLDVHLGALARRLRLLGVDTAYEVAATDDELVRRALSQRRMLLTRDRGLLRRTAVRGTAAYVRGNSVDAQLADVLDRFRVQLAPYARCSACNGLLRPVAKDEVRHLLQPGTIRSYDDYRQCEGCGRPYWRGAHARRLDAIIGRHRAP